MRLYGASFFVRPGRTITTPELLEQFIKIAGKAGCSILKQEFRVPRPERPEDGAYVIQLLHHASGTKADIILKANTERPMFMFTEENFYVRYLYVKEIDECPELLLETAYYFMQEYPDALMEEEVTHYFFEKHEIEEIRKSEHKKYWYIVSVQDFTKKKEES